MGSFTPLSNHLSSLMKMFTLLSSKVLFYSSDVSGKQSHDLRSWPSCAIHLWRVCFCLPNLQCAALATLNSMTYITLFMPDCFVLRMNKFHWWSFKELQFLILVILLLILLHGFIFQPLNGDTQESFFITNIFITECSSVGFMIHHFRLEIMKSAPFQPLLPYIFSPNPKLLLNCVASEL